MTAFLLRLLLIIVALWLLRRLLGALLGQPRRRPGVRSGSGGSLGRMVKDPVCGMYMDPKLALLLESRSGSFYFCSDECRQKFLARPGATKAS